MGRMGVAQRMEITPAEIELAIAWLTTDMGWSELCQQSGCKPDTEGAWLMPRLRQAFRRPFTESPRLAVWTLQWFREGLWWWAHQNTQPAGFKSAPPPSTTIPVERDAKGMVPDRLENWEYRTVVGWPREVELALQCLVGDRTMTSVSKARSKGYGQIYMWVVLKLREAWKLGAIGVWTGTTLETIDTNQHQ